MRKLQAAQGFVKRCGQDFMGKPWFIALELRHIGGHNSERLCLILRPKPKAETNTKDGAIWIPDEDAAERDRAEAQAMLDERAAIMDECLREALKDREGCETVTAKGLHFEVLVMRVDEQHAAEPFVRYAPKPHEEISVPPPDPTDKDE